MNPSPAPAVNDDELSARERIAAHKLCREADDLASRVPWASWLLRPLARMIRWMDAEIHERRDQDDWQ